MGAMRLHPITRNIPLLEFKPSVEYFLPDIHQGFLSLIPSPTASSYGMESMSMGCTRHSSHHAVLLLAVVAFIPDRQWPESVDILSTLSVKPFRGLLFSHVKSEYLE